MSENKKSSLSQALNSGSTQYGTAIIANFAIALKTSGLYGFAHINVTEALDDLHGYLDSFTQLEGDSEISRVDDFLFLNEARIKIDLGAVATYQYVAEILKVRDIGTISIKSGATKQELEALIRVLNMPIQEPENSWEEFRANFQTVTHENIEVKKYVARKEMKLQFTEDNRLIASSTYFRAIQFFDEQLDSIRTKKKANLKKVKGVIQSMVDLTLYETPTLMALVNIKDFGSFLASHSINVTVLSIALGAKLGFTKKHLGDLGLSAMLHDTGKAIMPEQLYNTEVDSLENKHLKALKGHVYTGVDILINQRISDAVVKSMNVAFLHHFRYDGTGYPRSQVVDKQNLFSRIVAVADFYDNKGRAGPTGGDPWTPDRVLRELMDSGGTEFDPLVVKAFSNLMGLYPVGCIVCLNTGELGTVIAPATNPRYLDRPTVRILSDENGMDADGVYDLMDRDATGAFTRSILKLYQQEEVQLELEEFLSVI